jgi:hypothetical protein
MRNGKLFLSFWNLCLANLPVGAFTHRRIPTDEARSCIEQARQEHRLFCVSDDDLLAPFRKREREKHEALCRVLTAHYGIALAERDFLSKDETDGDPIYSAVPLNCVQVREHDKLLVVTCYYVLGEKKAGELLPFEIEPTTVEFHMIESA